jgi:hypothetical protein
LPPRRKLFIDYAKGPGIEEEVADAFGRALASGTEAKTEQPGKHSAEAAAFALDAIKVTGAYRENMPGAARDSMSLIGQSYIHELTTGGRFDKAIDRSSGMGPPTAWTDIPGVTPSFYLSPGDAFNFLRTFTGDERATDEFDSAVASFYHDTLVTTAGCDGANATAHFDEVAMMFGDFAGIEFKAASDVRGQADAIDELIIDMGKNTLALGIDSIPVAGPAIDAAWTAAKTYAVSRLLDGWADSLETHVEKLDAKHVDYVERQRYDLARLLHEGGFPASPPPGELISKETGQLKTYDEMVKEAKREAAGGDEEKVLREKLTLYERWTDANQKLDWKVTLVSTMATERRRVRCSASLPAAEALAAPGLRARNANGLGAWHGSWRSRRMGAATPDSVTFPISVSSVSSPSGPGSDFNWARTCGRPSNSSRRAHTVGPSRAITCSAKASWKWRRVSIGRAARPRANSSCRPMRQSLSPAAVLILGDGDPGIPGWSEWVSELGKRLQDHPVYVP